MRTFIPHWLCGGRRRWRLVGSVVGVCNALELRCESTWTLDARRSFGLYTVGLSDTPAWVYWQSGRHIYMEARRFRGGGGGARCWTRGEVGTSELGVHPHFREMHHATTAAPLDTLTQCAPVKWDALPPPSVREGSHFEGSAAAVLFFFFFTDSALSRNAWMRACVFLIFFIFHFYSA